MTHLSNLRGAFPQIANGVEDGEALVFGPDGKGRATLVGRNKIEDGPRCGKPQATVGRAVSGGAGPASFRANRAAGTGRPRTARKGRVNSGSRGVLGKGDAPQDGSFLDRPASEGRESF